MNGLTFRIALSAACAGGDHDRCPGIINPETVGAVPCACLHHRTDTAGRLDVDAAGMLTERLAEVGALDVLERVADYIDARWPGRSADVDLVDHLDRHAVTVNNLAAVAGGIELEQVVLGVELRGDGRFAGLAGVDTDLERLRTALDLDALAPGSYIELFAADGSPRGTLLASTPAHGS